MIYCNSGFPASVVHLSYWNEISSKFPIKKKKIVARDGPTVELGVNGPLKFFYFFIFNYLII